MREVTVGLLPLVLLGLGLVALAALVGYVLARRIARPFEEPASAALTTSGAKLAALLEHERELAVHASHELRTPVTALRLELEDLARWPQTPPDVAAGLLRGVGELDRLSAAITELLAVSRDLSATWEIDLDLDALIADTVARVAALGRGVTHVPAGPLPTHLDPTPVVKALELLVGGGSEVRAADRRTHLEVSITTAGQDPEVAAHRRRPATELVSAAGGSVSQTADGVLLMLPKRPLAGS